MEFQREPGRIYAEEEGRVIAEVTFPDRDGAADIDHTFVDDTLRGQGVAGLHLWKRNVLLSIAGGTVLYMVLVQAVFV